MSQRCLASHKLAHVTLTVQAAAASEHHKVAYKKVISLEFSLNGRHKKCKVEFFVSFSRSLSLSSFAAAVPLHHTVCGCIILAHRIQFFSMGWLLLCSFCAAFFFRHSNLPIKQVRNAATTTLFHHRKKKFVVDCCWLQRLVGREKDKTHSLCGKFGCFSNRYFVVVCRQQQWERECLAGQWTSSLHHCSISLAARLRLMRLRSCMRIVIVQLRRTSDLARSIIYAIVQ